MLTFIKNFIRFLRGEKVTYLTFNVIYGARNMSAKKHQKMPIISAPLQKTGANKVP